jgi:hypothetical protein
MSNAAQLRRQADQRLLSQLCLQSAGRLRVIDSGDAGSPIRLSLRMWMPISPAYPHQPATDRRAEHQLRIVLPQRYPFAKPQVYLEEPVFHPNVFSSGLLCLGEQWIAGEGLDIFIKRVIDLLRFSPSLINTRGPAHREAAQWYEQQVRRSPAAFPVDQVFF